MNCYHPITIYNRSSNFNPFGNAFQFEVPCGKCLACQESKHQEYLLRAWMEYKQTTEVNNGFVYFDTLTYSNRYLPKYRGVVCFRKSDISTMLKKLRIYLERKGFNVKGNLKYFITSEFGGKTHRPHYHVIFFVSIPNLNVRIFWRALNKAWIYGIIDRFKTCQNRVVNSSAALNYVAKYVGKDQEWNENGMSEQQKVLFRKDIEQFQPFHLQSQGFGANFLNFVSLDSIINKGIIELKEKGFIKRFQLPRYYQRKLFYYFDKDDEGKVHWHLNDFGKEYKVNRLDEKIDSCEKQFRDIYYNLGYLYKDSKFQVDAYLDNRSFRDLATYVVVYRNKLWCSDDLELPNYKDFYRMSLNEDDYYNPFYTDDIKENRYNREYFKGYTITEKNIKYQDRFYNFDKLLKLLRRLNEKISIEKEKQDREREELRSRLKLVLINN